MRMDEVEETVVFTYKDFMGSVWDLLRNSWPHTLFFAFLMHVFFSCVYQLWPVGAVNFSVWMKGSCVFALWSFGMMVLLLLHGTCLEKQPWRDLVKGSIGSVLFRYLMAPILYAAGVGFGLMFFVFPGLYVLLAGMFFPIELHRDKKGPLEALRSSLRLSLGHTLRLLRILISFVSVFVVLRFCIASFVHYALIAQIITHLLEWFFIAIALMVYWQHYQWMLLLENGGSNE